MYTLRQSVDR